MHVTDAGAPSMWARLRYGRAAAVLARNAAGVPPALTFATPTIGCAALRNMLDDVVAEARLLAGTPDDLSTGLSRAAHAAPQRAFTETRSTEVRELADVAGVSASKSPSLLLSDIARHTSLADLFSLHRCGSIDALLEAGFDEAFRSECMIDPSSIIALRFGSRGPIYLCNTGGSHRIAAVRAELIRLGRRYPLAITIRSLEPGPDLIALLRNWDIVAATMSNAAVDMLFDRKSRLRTWSMRAIEPPSDAPAVAIVRRGTGVNTLTDELVKQGRMLSIRRFLEQNGCQVPV